MSVIWAKFIKAVKSFYQDNNNNNQSYVGHTYTNVRTVGYTLDNVTGVTPYGIGGIPNNQMYSPLFSVEDSSRSYVSLGFAQTIPPSSYTPTNGDSWHYGGNYITHWRGDYVRTAKIGDTSYQATQISGEWVNKILSDLIADNNSVLRDYINETIVKLYNEHTHPTPSGASGTPTPEFLMTDIDNSTKLSDDNTAITQGNTLVGPKGNNPPQGTNP